MTGKEETSMLARIATTARRGDSFIWLCGGALAVALLMIAGLLFVVVFNGLGYFWPHKLATVELTDGTTRLGVITDREFPLSGASGASIRGAQTQLKVGNRDIYGADFVWIADPEIESVRFEPEAVALERKEYGDFFGFLVEIRNGDRTVADGDAAWRSLRQRQPHAREAANEAARIHRHEIGAINRRIREAERELARIEEAGRDGAGASELRSRIEELLREYEALSERAARLTEEARRDVAVLRTIQDQETTVALADIVRAYRPNHMGLSEKLGHYGSKVVEFVAGEPRESNTEGGVFPAIFGTVAMTIIMSLLVTPFGVIAAFYLREYASQGLVVRIVRVAINNLAGVPSIVFGVFGLGFFVYFVGGGIDQILFAENLPNPTFGTGGILWASLTLALLTVPVVIVATEESIAAVPRGVREGSLALGASKFQTICKVVLPASIPGILTGVILAMARGAGEVAPLMITGVVKLAPELPIDGEFPFVHLDRKFMHLGFHIYDVGFQSPNIEAAKPMVYTTTLLLIAIVILLNIAAIRLRDRIRQRYKTGAFA